MKYVETPSKNEWMRPIQIPANGTDNFNNNKNTLNSDQKYKRQIYREQKTIYKHASDNALYTAHLVKRGALTHFNRLTLNAAYSDTRCTHFQTNDEEANAMQQKDKI